MGFLDAVGRTNSVGNMGQTLFNDVLAAGNFKQRQEAHGVEMRKEQEALAAAQAEQEKLHAPQNIRNSVLYLSLPEEKREEFANMYMKAGYADPDGSTTLFKRNQFLAENKQGVDFYFQARKEKAALMVDKAYQAMEKAQMGGDPAAVEKAQAEFQNAVGQAAAVDGKYNEVMGMYGKGEDSPFKEGATRSYKQGENEVTEEYRGGKWQPLASAPRQSPVTNVNIDMGLSKGAQAKAEGEVQEATDLYTGLQDIIGLAKPEYFTVAGKAQAGLERAGEIAGAVKNPKFLAEYATFTSQTEQSFNKYRKEITGVAAGPVELEMIRKTWPNKDMSYTEFMANAKTTGINLWKLAERRRRALAAGIMDPKKQKEFYRLLPLDKVGDPPAEVLAKFEAQGSTGIKTAEDYMKKWAK